MALNSYTAALHLSILEARPHKREMINHSRYRNRQQAMDEISEDIELFYNRQRLHTSLSNLTSAAYWKKFVMRRGAA